MSKKIIIIVLVCVAFVLVAVGAYALFFNNSNNKSGKQQDGSISEELIVPSGDIDSQPVSKEPESSTNAKTQTNSATNASPETKPSAGTDIKSIEGLDSSFCDKVTNPQGKAACMEEFGNN